MMFGYSWAWPMMLWMGLGWIFWLAVIGLVVWLIVRALDRRGATRGEQSPSELSAQETLRQRYARGEIDAATYEQMRERLSA